MAFFTGPIYSHALQLETQLSVILPHDTKSHHSHDLADGIEPRRTPKTLFLLHGLSDSSTMWERKTRIEILAEKYDLAVIMPECQRGFYLNMKNGYPFEDYIVKELPELVSQMFHLSVEPEDLLIAGLSMGGYGTMKCALKYPENYCFAGCFSGGFDIRSLMEDPEFSDIVLSTDRGGIFGTGSIPQDADLFYLVQNPASEKKVPLYITCGRQDFLYKMTQSMIKALEENNYPFKYEEWDGVHDWYFWDTSIEKMLAFYFSSEKQTGASL